MTIRDLIKKKRTEIGMTQSELAKLAGISQNRISEFESGNREMNSSSIDRILGALGVSLDILLSHLTTKTFDDLAFNSYAPDTGIGWEQAVISFDNDYSLSVIDRKNGSGLYEASILYLGKPISAFDITGVDDTAIYDCTKEKINEIISYVQGK